MVDGLQQKWNGRVDFTIHKNVNADREGSDLAAQAGVTAVPTMMLVSPEGAELERWVGVRTAEELEAAFTRASSP